MKKAHAEADRQCTQTDYTVTLQSVRCVLVQTCSETLPLQREKILLTILRNSSETAVQAAMTSPTQLKSAVSDRKTLCRLVVKTYD